MSGLRRGSVLYWFGAIALTGFGYLAIFSIGAPLFFSGVAMLAAGRWRQRRNVIWPALIGVWAFVLGYVLIAPLWCTGISGPMPAGSGAPLTGHTTCSNIIGINYSGGLDYRAPLLPALIGGLVLGAVAVITARWILGRSRGRDGFARAD